jgi:hypothetical protein
MPDRLREGMGAPAWEQSPPVVPKGMTTWRDREDGTMQTMQDSIAAVRRRGTRRMGHGAIPCVSAVQGRLSASDSLKDSAGLAGAETDRMSALPRPAMRGSAS